jgi:colanic acid/amylovoran biosynthesis protein
MRFYLTGHHTFSNRGCEAIVRSTVLMLNQTFGQVEILVPSSDIERDQQQWPEAGQLGVRFVQAYLPAYTRYWVNFLRLPFNILKKASWPFPFPKYLLDDIKSVDAVLSVGGDNYSLDYRLPSMLMGMDRMAMRLGKPVFIWGASVGPFEAEPHFVPTIREHLSNMTMIFARESVTYDYLTKKLCLANVVQMADPAFTLAKQPVEITSFWPNEGVNGVIGFNISPLIERYKSNGQDLRAEAIQFVHDVVAKGFGVLLVPHVIPLDGSVKGNDAIYMANMLEEFKSLGSAVTIMPAHFNASQIKQVIGQLRFFIGARTHATIAALSSAVPTLSIAYSVKAHGINQDLLGDMPVVLPTPELSSASLMVGLNYLIDNELQIKAHLNGKLPEWRERVVLATNKMKIKIESRAT